MNINAIAFTRMCVPWNRTVFWK